MYCINCGVKLAQGLKVCPLCDTKVPVQVEDTESLYPQKPKLNPEQSAFWGQMILTILFILPIAITLLCDYNINGKFTWSGFVVGALVMVYLVLVLPFWFKKPNPAIFVPTSFLSVGAYLWFVNFITNGDWFLSFAFPVTLCLALIFTAFATLLKYLKRGKLYIYGSTILSLGAFTPLCEFLLNLTFGFKTVYWSLYPLTALAFLGGFLIFLAICRPARETIERKFFF